MNNNYEDYQINSGPIKVLDITIMHGANYFSGGPVVLFRTDLGEFDEVFTNQIPDFYKKLKNKLPSLHDHHCSVGKEGGFFERVKEGTLLGHVIEHSAIELQTLAGMDVAFGKTRSAGVKRIYNVVFRYLDELAGVYAGKAAYNLINAILTNKDFDVDEIVKNLINIREIRLLGPSTQAIVDEAIKQNIPNVRLDKYNLVLLGTGKYQKYIKATITSDTSLIAVETAADKYLTAMMLNDLGLPIPKTQLIPKADDAISFQKQLKLPIVIKPRFGFQGHGVSINLTDPIKINNAFIWAKSFNNSHIDDNNIIAQQYIAGNSYRLLVIDYKFVAAVKLNPPVITGNGKDTIAQLIEKLNKNPNRGIGDKLKLTKVKIDEITKKILEDENYTLETVLPTHKVLSLKKSGSLKLGGSANDVTNEVCEENKFIVQRASKVLGLNVSGIDIIAPNLSKPILQNYGAIIEINAAPDFRMHIKPTTGNPCNVAKNFIDMLFKDKSKTKVPVFSVSGSFGKTLCVKLINHCLNLANHKVGMAHEQGLFVDGKCVKKGDMTQAENATLILKDPTIDSAVFETPSKSILDKGLGYKFADFGIVLNIYDTPSECKYIRDVDDLAYAISTVAEQVYENGHTILNADNKFVLEMGDRVYNDITYFSKKFEISNNSKIKKEPDTIVSEKDNTSPNPFFIDNQKILQDHVDKGGVLVTKDNNNITIIHGNKKYSITTTDKLLFCSKYPKTCYLDSVLACISALYNFGICLDIIKKGIETYQD